MSLLFNSQFNLTEVAERNGYQTFYKLLEVKKKKSVLNNKIIDRIICICNYVLMCFRTQGWQACCVMRFTSHWPSSCRQTLLWLPCLRSRRTICTTHRTELSYRNTSSTTSWSASRLSSLYIYSISVSQSFMMYGEFVLAVFFHIICGNIIFYIFSYLTDLCWGPGSSGLCSDTAGLVSLLQLRRLRCHCEYWANNRSRSLRSKGSNDLCPNRERFL